MKSNKSIITIIILIINLIFIFLYVLPKYQESYKLQLDLEKKQKKYDNQSNYYKELVGVIKDLDERYETLEKIKSALPSNL